MQTTSPNIRDIFFPILQKKIADLDLRLRSQSPSKFAYYTTAQTAMQIIQNKELWMRNALMMNDYSEITYGKECADHAFQIHKKPFLELLGQINPHLPEIAMNYYETVGALIQQKTYITCFSEHPSPDDLDEEMYGRLSMWRAYGAQSGVALIFRPEPMRETYNGVSAYLSPVTYADKRRIVEEFGLVLSNIRESLSFLKTVSTNVISNHLCLMFHSAFLSIKHPGFKEEREWRLIFSPPVYSSDYLFESVESVRGVPQRVVKIDLSGSKSELSSIKLDKFLDHIIIGPTEHHELLRQAFIELLIKAGIPDAFSKVRVSNIPLRHI